MNENPTPREIQRWFPDRWSEIVGNRELVQTLKNFILNGLCNLLITGPSRTGKTRTINLAIRALLCRGRTDSLDPCGQCPACKLVEEGRTPHAGIFAAATGSDYCYHPIDCANVTGDEFDSLHADISLENDRTIIYLDEIADLKGRRLERKLLKRIDETPAIWIASSISVKRTKGKRKGEWKEPLSKEMRGRFGIKVGTFLPHPDDLHLWIMARSEAWNITILDPEKTVRSMIDRTGCCVGHVIQFFAMQRLAVIGRFDRRM